jgi:hypothetical protein
MESVRVEVSNMTTQAAPKILSFSNTSTIRLDGYNLTAMIVKFSVTSDSGFKELLVTLFGPNYNSF